MVQEQAVPVGGDVVGGVDGDVGRVHVGHMAPVWRRAHQPVEGHERDPGGEEDHGAQPAVAAEPSHAVRGSIESWSRSRAWHGAAEKGEIRADTGRLWIGRGDLGVGIRWRPAEAGGSPAKCYVTTRARGLRGG